MPDRIPSETFGCDVCWPTSADAAWQARRALDCEAELVDESHYRIAVLVCSRCSQRFLSVFTEIIDWTDGEDPQYWVILPLTTAEFADLARRHPPSETDIDAIGPGRRCLRRDVPKGSPPGSYWSVGVHVGRHD